MNARSVLAFALLGLGAVVLATGCSRVHLSTNHGRAYRQIFAAQDANPDRKSTKSVYGLDSQEAAIIAGSYRKALSAKSDMAGNTNRLLMMTPQAPVNDAAGLPSSVPSGN